MSDLAIETNALHKSYGHLRAVDGVDLRVPRGAVYGFLGRNGAGKTTTIRMLAGLAHSTSGELRVLDLDPMKDRVAMLSRAGFTIDRTLIPSMTGSDLVRFNRGFFPDWNDALANKYAEMLEIPMKQKFRKLSTGNQTKLSLLLALAQGAELLVLDEPTAGLDPVVTDQLLRLLVEDFASEGRTLFLSSHHLSEIERVADWVGIIDRGKLLLQAQLDDLRANFRRVTVIGTDQPLIHRAEILSAKRSEATTEYVLRADADAFFAELRNQGATVLSISPMGLPEIFLEVVGKGEADVPVEALA
jgi:ABC-2 type transport system ATP-binding protein